MKSFQQIISETYKKTSEAPGSFNSLLKKFKHHDDAEFKHRASESKSKAQSHGGNIRDSSKKSKYHAVMARTHMLQKRIIKKDILKHYGDLIPDQVKYERGKYDNHLRELVK